MEKRLEFEKTGMLSDQVAAEKAKFQPEEEEEEKKEEDDEADTEDWESSSESEEETSDSLSGSGKEEEDQERISLLREARRKAKAVNAAFVADFMRSKTDQTSRGTEVDLWKLSFKKPWDEEKENSKGNKNLSIREANKKWAEAKTGAKSNASKPNLLGGRNNKETSRAAIKENFLKLISPEIVTLLNPYWKARCKMARITSKEDFKYLARKLASYVMRKEIKTLSTIEHLKCTHAVKEKARGFVEQYMSRFGAVYIREGDD